MATRSLGSLTLDMILKLGGYEAGLDKAARISEKRMKQIQATASKVGAVIGASFVAAGAGLIAFISAQTDAIASYQDVAEKIGDTAEAVASLKAATDVSGTSFDTVAAASIKLTSALSKTDDEAKGVGNALKAIGINIEDFKKLSPVEQIDAVAKALAGFEDGANKTAVAVALFGKAGAELLPFLNDLADGAERQKNLTQEQIDAANELQETIAALKGGFGSLAQELAAELIPVALEVVKAFAGLIKEVKLIGGDNSIKEFAQSAAIGFATTIEFIVRTVRTLNVLRLGLQEAFQDLRLFAKAASLLNPITTLVSKGTGEDFDSILKAREEAALKFSDAFGDLLDTNTTAVSDALRKSFAETEEFAKKSEEVGRKALKFSGIPPEAEKNAKKAAKAVDEYATSLESARAIQEEVERLQQAQNKLLDEAASVYERTRTPLEKFNAELKRLNELRNTFVDSKPLIDDVTYRRAVVQIQDDLTGLKEKTEETADEMTVFMDQAARNIQDAFADFLFDPFEGGLKGMLMSFEQTLRRMAAEAAAAQIFKSLAGGLTGSGGFFDFLLGLGGGLGGGGAPISPKPKALGGAVYPGQPYLVGEKGPELFSPASAGTIIPNGMGAVQNFNISIAAPAGTVDRRTMQNTAAEVARAARNASFRNG